MKTDSRQSKFCPPLRHGLTMYGDKFVTIAPNAANGMYCYRRTTSEGLTYYEVFKAPKARDRDGNLYAYYPTSSQFGFGTALCIRGDDKRTADKIAFYISNAFDAGRYRAS